MLASTPAATPPSTVRLLLRLLASILIFAALLFVPAGRLDWVEGWLLIALWVGFVVAMLVHTRRHAADLLAERSRTAANVKRWDLTILRIYGCLLLALLIVAGLDAGRFRWWPVTPALEIGGLAAVIASGAIVWWTMTTNPFLSRHARIQDDRGQAVVTGGPYRYARHPMYGAIGPLVVGIALGLGSGVAVVPAVLVVAVFVVRTILEDRMLHEELPGYRDYAARVRYRWWPGIW